MSHRNNSNDDNSNAKDRLQRENEHRVENLIDIVEKKTRTDRHLEQHSDIGDPSRLERPKELQREREDEINHLKNTIAYGKHDNGSELENLKENYKFAEGYIEHNGDHMRAEDLESLKRKQENRKDQMDVLE